MQNLSETEMVNISQITRPQTKISLIAVGVLLAVFGFGYFEVGFDQGQIFSIAEGQIAYTQMNGVGYLHEITHDMRHASGFPCH
jgi:hypothetical protein